MGQSIQATVTDSDGELPWRRRSNARARALRRRRPIAPAGGGPHGDSPHVAALAFSFLAARAFLRSALAALASGELAVLVNRSFKRTALPESWRR